MMALIFLYIKIIMNKKAVIGIIKTIREIYIEGVVKKWRHLWMWRSAPTFQK